MKELSTQVALREVSRMMPSWLYTAKRIFVGLAYTYVFIVLAASTFFDVSAAFFLLACGVMFVAMHFELSTRIDALNRVAAMLVREAGLEDQDS